MNLNLQQRLNTLREKMSIHPKFTLSAIAIFSSLAFFSLSTGSIMGAITPTFLTGSTVYASLTFSSLINRAKFYFFRKRMSLTASKKNQQEIQNTISNLSAQNTQLTEELREMQSIASNANAQNNLLASENNELRMLIQKYKADIQKRQVENNDLTTENAILTNKNQEKSIELLSHIARIGQLNTELAKEKSKNIELTDEIKELKEKQTHLNVENKTHEKNIKALQAVNNSLYAHLNNIKLSAEAGADNNVVEDLLPQTVSPKAIFNAYSSINTSQSTHSAPTQEQEKPKKSRLYPQL